MGLFDGQGINGAMPTNLAEMGRGVGQSISRGLIDPYMESKGFISKENQVLSLMKSADLSSAKSVSETFNKIMVISPQAAAEFQKQVLPLVTAQQNELKLNTPTAGKDAQVITVGVPDDPTKTMQLERQADGTWKPIVGPDGKPYIVDKYKSDNVSYTGTIPQGYEAYVDKDGRTKLRAIPGGPEDTTKETSEKNYQLQIKSNTVLSVVGDIRGLIKAANEDKDSFIFGVAGKAQSYIPGTRRSDVQSAIETLNARVGFDELQAMRDASPTGGALGQVSELELRQLNNSLGSLNLSQSEEQFLKNLKRVETQYQRILERIAETGDGSYLPRNDGVVVVNPAGI